MTKRLNFNTVYVKYVKFLPLYLLLESLNLFYTTFCNL